MTTHPTGATPDPLGTDEAFTPVQRLAILEDAHLRLVERVESLETQVVSLWWLFGLGTFLVVLPKVIEALEAFDLL